MLLTCLACEEARRPSPGGGSRSDGAAALDAAGPEAGSPDGGFDPDGAAADAGATDATASDGELDAGPAVDAALPRDGGAADATRPPAPDAGFADAAAPDAAPMCRQGCTVPADCALPAPIYDATHWRCDRGACTWTGCRSAAECGGAGWDCIQRPGWATPSCVRTCGVAADCTTPNNVLYDGDNYACNGGICDYTGCNSDQECMAGLSDTRYRCFSVPGWTVPSCALSCSGPADCSLGQPAFDGDNYSCIARRCEFIGCNADQECRDSFMNPQYVCR